MGFSWADWLDENDHFLDQTPEVGRQYKIRLPANFIATDLGAITFRWLPADSAQNGFDKTSIGELAELKFLTGAISPTDGPEPAVLFVPEQIQSPEDMLTLDCRPVEESDTLMDCRRYEYSFERFVCIEFSAEGNVSSQYVFLDSQLIMLEHCVWGDAHFWIGNGSLSPSLAQKIFKPDE